MSSLLAAVAGVAIVSRIQATAVPGGGTSLTSALAVALLGGANPHGGRLGLAGTILAAVVVGGVNVLLVFHGQEVWVQLLATAAPGVVGLLATLVLRAVTR